MFLSAMYINVYFRPTYSVQERGECLMKPDKTLNSGTYNNIPGKLLTWQRFACLALLRSKKSER